MLTKAQIDAYHSNGFIGVESVLSTDEIVELRQVTDEFVEKSRLVTEHNDVFDLEAGHSAETPRLRRLKEPAKQHPVYDRMMRHPKILAMVTQLIGNDLRQNGHKLNMKSPDGGSPVEWHQDWAFYPHTNDDLLAVGVAMDDMLLENGCLLVLPGSHKGPIYSHHQNGVFVGAVTDANFDPRDAVPIELKAGGVSIHHVRLLHASAPNRSARQRRLLLYQYCAADAWPLAFPNLEQFNGNIVQGDPTLEPRLAAVPARIPLPTSERKGSIFEVQSALSRSAFSKRDM